MVSYQPVIAGVRFTAVQPADSRMFRRGGVVIWARRSPRWRALSVQACPLISIGAGMRPIDADELLVSPPITDGRRLREVLKAVQASLWGGAPFEGD